MSRVSDKVNAILARNKDKNFVKRIINKNDYPVLKNADGTISTHAMVWGESDGKYFVYPEVIQSGDELIRLPINEARSHAMKTKEYIRFPSSQEADWFSKNYKSVWNTKTTGGTQQ